MKRVTLAAIVAAGTICADAGEIDLEFRRGDANSSGVVDGSDVQFIATFLQEGDPAPKCEDAADANNDEVISSADVLFLVHWLFDGGPTPPAPGPSVCGEDPAVSPDPLGCADSVC